jgi:hypothetical protein
LEISKGNWKKPKEEKTLWKISTKKERLSNMSVEGKKSQHMS